MSPGEEMEERERRAVYPSDLRSQDYRAALAAAEAARTGDWSSVPRNRLAAALRRVISLSVVAELDEEAVLEAAAATEGVAEILEAAAGAGRRPRPQPGPTTPPHEFFPTSPVIGLASPIAPPVIVRVVRPEDGGTPEVHGTATFDFPYEGPPTCVHGGVIAEVFDELLGLATIAADWPAMTGTLTVRYRKPTPLHTELRLLGRCVGREGRKVKIWGAIYHGEVLTAEAEGIFIEVQPRHFLELAEGGVLTTDPAVLEAMRADAAEAEEDDGDGG